MLMTCWIVQQKKPVKRGSIADGTAPVLEWRDMPAFGRHPSRLAAMRSYVETVDPDFIGALDRQIRGQWRAFARSIGVRTVRHVP